ncbi:hypothetical protein ABK040_007595 [Willaertia magna]
MAEKHDGMIGGSTLSNNTTEKVFHLSREQVIEGRKQHLAAGQYTFYQTPVYLVKGDRQYCYDESDKKYVDCYSNVSHVGYCHPHVIKAMLEQMQSINTNTRYLHDKIVQLAKKLTSKMPQGSNLSVCYFVNSGSEANDLAVRLARVFTKRNTIIALENSYHGTTGTCTGISSSISTGNGEKCPDWGYYARDVEYVRIPDLLRGPYSNKVKEDKEGGVEYASEEYAKDIDGVFEKRGNDQIAAYIHESIQGVGGQIVFPEGYLKKVYNKIRNHGGICIADEVQVGFGRTGKYWAFEHEGVCPDILTLGKPFGNGQPIGCVVTTPEIAKAFDKSQYFNTFGGNPVSCAIGLSVIEVIDNENLMENSRIVGEKLISGLKQLMTKHKLIGEVRGRGLFLGIEFVKDFHQNDLTPAINETAYIWERTKELGVLVGSGGPLKNVIRIKPPICFNEENANFLIECMDKALTEVETGNYQLLNSVDEKKRKNEEDGVDNLKKTKL